NAPVAAADSTPATSTTPKGGRRKRVSDLADSSLVLETPPGADENRRQTRSQTRGTPPVVAAPMVKKPRRDSGSDRTNGSSAAKGRRGRPPKPTSDSEQEAVSSKPEESVPEKKEEAPAPVAEAPETKTEPVVAAPVVTDK